MTELNVILKNAIEEKNEKLIPENIRNGVEIFGVTGNADILVTSDATATASDIINPKTAYVNGEKIEGTIMPTYSPAQQVLTTIGTENDTQIQYCGAGYIVKIASDAIRVYKLSDDQTEVNFITSYDLSGIANLKLSSFTISMVTADNDIRMVACRSDKDGNLFYFRFVLITETIEYVGNFRPHGQGSMYTNGGFALKISPTGNIMMLFIGQANNDGGTFFTLRLNTSSIHTATQLWYQRYGQSCSDMQFFDNDTKMSITINSTQYRYVLNNFSVTNTYNSTDTNTLLMSNDLQYGYSRKDYTVYKLSGDWTSLTKVTAIRAFTSTDTYGGLFSNNFINISGTLYRITDNGLEEILTGLYATNVSADNVAAVARLTNSTEQVIINTNVFDDMILTSLTKDGTEFMALGNILITSDKVLAGNKFVNADGEQIGTMSNNGELNYIPSTEAQIIPEGYTSGGTISGDVNLISENIKTGVSIFGVEGAADMGKLSEEEYSNCCAMIAEMNPDIEVINLLDYTKFYEENQTGGFEIIDGGIRYKRTNGSGASYATVKLNNMTIGESYTFSCDMTGTTSIIEATQISISDGNGGYLANTYCTNSNSITFTTGTSTVYIKVITTGSNFDFITVTKLMLNIGTEKQDYIVYSNEDRNLQYGIQGVLSDYRASLNTSEQVLGDSSTPKYTRLTYIESDGNQYVDSGVMATNGTKIEFKTTIFEDKEGSIFGVWWHSGCMMFTHEGGKLTTYYPNTSMAYHLDPVSDISYKLTPTSLNIYNLSESSLLLSDTPDGTQSSFDKNVFIFARNSFDSYEEGTGAHMRLYSFKIYDGDTLVRDYIPVLDKDGVTCLYDKQNKEYYYNLGSGTFTAGPEI